MSAQASVYLVPWDADSGSHREVLYTQRKECGWGHDNVETEWRDAQGKGTKCIFWIVSKSGCAQTPQNSEGSYALRDTSQTLNGATRTATKTYFSPVGHISLDSVNHVPDSVAVDLPSTGVFWIKTFYVRQAFQGQGIGRAAMDMVEDMATREPLNATTLALDTMQRDDQLREEFSIASLGYVPKVANEDWYLRRGYQTIATVQNYWRHFDRTGRIWDVRTVFMRKEIRQGTTPGTSSVG